LLLLGCAGLAANRAAVWIKREKGFGGRDSPSNAGPVDEAVLWEEVRIPDKVYEGGFATHRFRIYNGFSNAFTVDSFAVSCDCLEVQPESGMYVPAGEDRWFRIKYAPKPGSLRADSWNDQTVATRFSATYRFDDSSSAQSRWTLTATVAPTIRLKPAMVQLGSLSQYAPAVEQLVAVDLGPDVIGVDLAAPAEWYAATKSESHGAGGRRVEVLVRYVGPLSPRTLESNIDLTPIKSDGTRLPAKQLKVSGQVARDIAPVPPALQLGRQTLGELVTEAITFRSRTGRTFEVTKATAQGEGVRVNGLPENKGSYTVQVSISKLGEQSIPLVFCIREPMGLEYEIVVPLRYLGSQRPSPVNG
jgi:hypothetical protein